jgi:hypothetical protein
MATRSTSGISVLAGPAYAIAILFVLLPIIDTFSQTWPTAFSNPGWRYGTIGIGANYLISMLLGALGLSALAATGQHRRTLRFLAVLDGIAMLVLLVAVIGFLLDAVQVRSGIPAGEVGTRRTFDIGAAKAAFKYVLSAVVLAWLALASWKRASAVRREADESGPALVGERRR